MTAALVRPPPLPFQREEWLAEALQALEDLGPREDASALVLDASPCVVLTAEGGGRRETWVQYEPFRLLRGTPRPRLPGTSFVVLTAEGGGITRTAVLFEPFRLVPRPSPAGARLRPARKALTCTAPPLRRTERGERHARRWARPSSRPVEVQAIGAPRAKSSTASELPTETAPAPVSSPAPELRTEAAPAHGEWPWPPCPLPPVDAHPPELRRAALLEHRLWDLTEGNPLPYRKGAGSRVPPGGPTAWPVRRGDGPTFSEFWLEVKARDAGERRALKEATAAAKEAGFLVRRTLGPTGAVYVATLEDVGLREAMGGSPVVLEAASVEELRTALRPYWRALLRLGRDAKLPRRKHPKKSQPPEQLALPLGPIAPAKQRKQRRAPTS